VGVLACSVLGCSALGLWSCNAVLGIEDASLRSCDGVSCDAGVYSLQTDAGPSTVPAPGAGNLGTGGGNSGGANSGGSNSDGSGTEPPAGGSAPTPAPSETNPDPSLDPGSSDPDDNSGNGSGSQGDGNGQQNPGGEQGPGGQQGPGGGQGQGGQGQGGQGQGGSPPDDGEEPAPGDEEPDPAPPPSPCQGRAPGEAFCTGAVRTVCAANGVVDTTFPCASAAHCTQSTGAECAVCLDTDVRCDEGVLLACNAAHTSLDAQACGSPALCDAIGRRCLEPSCTPNQARCDGSVLSVCNATQTALEPVGDCGLPELCNEPAARCNTCVPGVARCVDGNTIAVCDTSGQAELQRDCALLEACVINECILLGGVPVPGL
jgi:hypothetical protein